MKNGAQRTLDAVSLPLANCERGFMKPILLQTIKEENLVDGARN